MKRNFNYILFSLSLIFTSLGSANAASNCVSCGPDSLSIPLAIPKFVSKLVTLVQILIPVILIVVGMIKYAKAVTSGEEKVIKETNSSFIRSIITGISIFLVVAIVKFAFGLLGSEGNGALYCVSCFISDDNCKTVSCPKREELPSGTGKTYYCFVCNSDNTKRFWQTAAPGTTTACPDGYYASNYSKKECSATSLEDYACYRCSTEIQSNNYTGRYIWHQGKPSTTYDNNACPAGWLKESGITSKSDCIARNEKEVSCWQCNSNSKLYWGTSSEAENYCGGAGKHSYAATQANCN